MSKGPESKVKDAIKAYLTSIGAWFYMAVPTGYSRRGVGDFIACVPVTITPEMVGRRVGLFVMAEAKATGGTTTPWQDKELGAVAAAGGIAIVAVGDDAVNAIKRGLGCL